MSTTLRHNPLARVLPAVARRRHGPIGLDLGPEHVNLVQMAVRGDGARIRALASVPYPDGRDAALASPAALKALLRAAMKGQPFAGRSVVTCMPADKVRLWPESYRVTHDRSEGATVLGLAMERLGGEPSDWVVDFIPVRRASADAVERDAIITAARRDAVLSRLELIEGAGLEVQAVEVGPVAIQRLVAAVADTTAEQNLLTINMARGRTYITVFAGRRLMVERDAAIGEQDLLTRLARDLDMEVDAARRLLYRHGLAADADADAGAEEEGGVAATIAAILKPALMSLMEEVEKVVIYTASKLRGAAVDRVYLLGGIARWPGAAATLNRMLSLPVDVLDPLEAFASANAGGGGEQAGNAGVTLATGCALRGIVDGV